MNTPHPYDLVIGLDRSDKKADLCLIDIHTGQRRAEIIDTTPEALWEWLLALLDWKTAAPVKPAPVPPPKCPCCGKPMFLLGTLPRAPTGARWAVTI